MKFLRSLMLLMVCVSLAGCVTPSPNMRLSEPDTSAITPQPDKALVYFVRTSMLGYAINAAVYDGDQFVGFVPFNQKLPHFTDPGAHVFMVVSEAADFLKADLLPGKTYYVNVLPRMGAWRARFSLEALTKEKRQTADMQAALTKARLIRNKSASMQWAEANKASVAKKKAAYFPKWQARPPETQPTLRASDGE